MVRFSFVPGEPRRYHACTNSHFPVPKLMLNFICLMLIFLFVAGTFLLAGWMVVARVSEASKSTSTITEKRTGSFAAFFGLAVVVVLAFGLGGLISGNIELMIVGGIVLAVLIVGSMLIGFHNAATCPECGGSLSLNDSMRGKVGGGPGVGSTYYCGNSKCTRYKQRG